MAAEQPLVAIVGPTASGKTSCAIELALQCDGEIICADSRTVFSEMDIGTAKPTEQEQRGVPHWGLDLVRPDEMYSAVQFQDYAYHKIDEIRTRGRLPILVGGTGLYVDSVLFRYEYQNQDMELRHDLSQKSVIELTEYCHKNNIKLPYNAKNRRHLITKILHNGNPEKRRSSPILNTIVVGIATTKSALDDNIAKRTEQIFADGVVDEAKILGKKYGWDNEAMTGNCYPLIRAMLDGQASLAQTMQTFSARDRQLAKRQMTWFRRNPYILWSDKNKLVDMTKSRLAIEHKM